MKLNGGILEISLPPLGFNIEFGREGWLCMQTFER
jgi:hypothetical protein